MDPSIDLSLRDLRLILEVAEKQSFTVAAEAVHMSQSALSRAVNEAERRVGARLFERTTRSVEPTAVGRELVRLGSAMVEHYERGLRELVLFRDGLGGIVRIAALPSIAATMLPAIVAELRVTSPDIVLDIADTLAHVATEQLLTSRVDFAITVDEGLPDELALTPLTKDRFHAVFRDDHPFHGRDQVTWADLAEQPIVSFGEASSLRALTDETFSRLRLAPAQAAEAQNIAVIAGLVAAGLGVAAAPAMVLPLMSFAGLSSAELVEPTVDRDLVLAYVPGRSISPAAQHVATTLRTSLA
ncbi:LysR family transcriptional regulator [Aeromicrobium endophyticum]|uniref:LysR family transcriptional regulator n=1 Tax=Aeromicrobium endophyticum TaxID=2292704 RepID=A0A371PAN4_9ACTN|nr:LysR family transcriptional regulator [Aeromicrobium endophyticum]REK72961.1 LysR family transcriptional regulator [Aeromicrobium endophyticum]